MDRAALTLSMDRVVFDSDTGSMQNYTTLSVEDFLDYDSVLGGRGFSIDHAVQPTPSLPFADSFHGKFVEITDHCTDPRACYMCNVTMVKWHWRPFEQSGYIDIQLWKYDGRWTLLNDTSQANTLAVGDMSGFSTFALLANYSPSTGGGGHQGGNETPPEEGTSPECSSDDTCAVNERCVQGGCELFPCQCGHYERHGCVAYECCSDSACPTGQICYGNSCMREIPEPQFECKADSGCSQTSFCDIAPGAAGGSCEDVQTLPCGEVKDHKFVAYGYECGTEPGCPSCPSGGFCENHACQSAGINCPTTGVVGEEKTCSATMDGQPCANCDIMVTDPDGKSTGGKTDEEGNFQLPLKLKGTYMVKLLKAGGVVKTVDVTAVAPGSKPVAPGQDYSGLLLGGGILLLIAAGLYFLFGMKKKKGKKE
jgi:hypothetical protein